MTTITIAHHFYKGSVPSGENNVVRREALAYQNICTVNPLFFHTDSLSIVDKFHMIANLAYARGFDDIVSNHLKMSNSRIFHAHNVWPSFTYSAFAIAKDLGVSTLHTLHNFRLFASVDRFFGVNGMHRAANSSDKAHLRRMPPIYSGMLQNRLYSHAIDTSWKNKLITHYIDKFICMTSFQRNIAISAGIPAQKIAIKPNFLDHERDPGIGPGSYALYIGRLSPEKGIDFLIKSWDTIPFPLTIIGSGELAYLCKGRANVQFLGLLPHVETLELLTRARFLVMTSNWYEGFPLVLVEALACGTPCLVPSLGGLPEIIKSGHTGLLFDPDEMIDFKRQIQNLWDLAPSLRNNCRQEFELCYSRKTNEAKILDIYSSVL